MAAVRTAARRQRGRREARELAAAEAVVPAVGGEERILEQRGVLPERGALGAARGDSAGERIARLVEIDRGARRGCERDAAVALGTSSCSSPAVGRLSTDSAGSEPGRRRADCLICRTRRELPRSVSRSIAARTRPWDAHGEVTLMEPTGRTSSAPRSDRRWQKRTTAASTGSRDAARLRHQLVEPGARRSRNRRRAESVHSWEAGRCDRHPDRQAQPRTTPSVVNAATAAIHGRLPIPD